MGMILELEDVYVKYNGDHVLENISLTLGDREFLSIIGPNGGGKTTLIKTILGLIQPCGGRWWTKKNLVIGYVPQHTKFDRRFPINVFDVVLTGRLGDRIRLFKGYTAEDKRKVWEMLDQIGLKDLSKRQIGQLSGGQLQKVLIARALVAEPELLILDEPTANLDGDNKKDIYDLLHRYNEKHAVILVTHDLEYIEDNKRQVVLLNRKIRYRGDAQTRKRAFDHQHGGEDHV